MTACKVCGKKDCPSVKKKRIKMSDKDSKKMQSLIDKIQKLGSKYVKKAMERK